jgi:hypothetical protein
MSSKGYSDASTFPVEVLSGIESSTRSACFKEQEKELPYQAICPGNRHGGVRSEAKTVSAFIWLLLTPDYSPATVFVKFHSQRRRLQMFAHVRQGAGAFNQSADYVHVCQSAL